MSSRLESYYHSRGLNDDRETELSLKCLLRRTSQPTHRLMQTLSCHQILWPCISAKPQVLGFDFDGDSAQAPIFLGCGGKDVMNRGSEVRCVPKEAARLNELQFCKILRTFDDIFLSGLVHLGVKYHLICFTFMGFFAAQVANEVSANFAAREYPTLVVWTDRMIESGHPGERGKSCV
ncbi:hypothetical protein B5807_00013 [Epicoccum nigrum]|uniref:Uncharacterized protein n=1 Tax=Epicoccum nigrum TaxID=105696 RepID=A0A1Y2MDX4_EPING|nr:hypothetical protein B5807_00013 [Epicoccum nigrum]